MTLFPTYAVQVSANLSNNIQNVRVVLARLRISERLSILGSVTALILPVTSAALTYKRSLFHAGTQVSVVERHYAICPAIRQIQNGETTRAGRLSLVALQHVRFHGNRFKRGNRPRRRRSPCKPACKGLRYSRTKPLTNAARTVHIGARPGRAALLRTRAARGAK